MTKRLTGLSEREVVASLKMHGSNSLERQKSKGFLSRFFENLSDPIIKILLLALAVQVIFTFGKVNFVELGGIIAAILISTTVSTVSEYRSALAFERLSEESEGQRVGVLRSGVLTTIPISEVVVGDVIYLSVGERVCADGAVIEGKISVDQSALNGESEEVEKLSGIPSGWELSDPHRVYRGSLITEGSAIMRTERVGEGTFFGGVAREVQTETRVSPLKLRLSTLAKQISRIGYLVAALVGLAFLFNAIFIDNGFDKASIISFLSDRASVFSLFIRAVTLMITVVVVAAPEGLPMMITVVLSANMKRMSRDGIMIKKLVGIETAGSMNILFTDKTGTLTVGEPRVDGVITSEGVLRGRGELTASGEIIKNLTLSAKYNSEVKSDGNELVGGNATDRAIYMHFASEAPEVGIISRESFNSDKKYSSVTLSDKTVLKKGAPEIIFSSVTHTLLPSGETVYGIPERIKEEYKKAVSEGKRVLAVSVRRAGQKGDVLVGLITMRDKLRRATAEAVRRVIRAGIQVVMITGDGKDTACAIGEECGIYSRASDHIAITSSELRTMTDSELKEIMPRLRIVARALPQDKTRLVRVCQEMELVVGMTGDGINDAPSLKLADIGFAMGSGTEIAKSASDAVILDNSFSAVGKTVLYGRTIFKSIRKFITFQLIMNLAACGISLIGQFIGIDTPITIIQMLWINIIMDTLGGLAFAGEPPLDYYMNEPPKRRDEPILSGKMLKRIAISGFYTLALCAVFLSSPAVRAAYGFENSDGAFYTAFYALFVFAGIFNCFAARCERLRMLSNIGKNKPFVLIMLAISVIQIAMIYLGGSVFRCVPLQPSELLTAVLMALTVIPFDMVRRIVEKLK